MNQTSRRRLIGMVGTVGIAALTGCMSEDGGPSTSNGNGDADGNNMITSQATTQPPTETTQTQTPSSTTTAINIESKTYSGSGTKVIQNQQFNSGLVVAEVAYSNLEYDFSSIQVTLRNIESGRTAQLYGESGSVENGEGANVVNETGAYHVDIESQGDWEITISQPRSTRTDAETAPIDLSGTGQTVTGPYYIEETRVLSATNDAEGDFIVTLWPMRAPWTDFEMPLLEAGAGKYESSFTFNGMGYLHVNSDGDWTIQIE